MNTPNNTSRFNLRQAKQNLYSELLKMSPEELTENEIELGYILAKDKEIQEILDKSVNKGENMKWQCIKCKKIPEEGWLYMPDDGDNIDIFYCDDCVPRGCSCQRELKEGIDWDSKEVENDNNYVDGLDELGRKLPCVEFMPDDNDFPTEQRLPKEDQNNKEK